MSLSATHSIYWIINWNKIKKYFWVNSNEIGWKRFWNEFLFYLDSLNNDLLDSLCFELVFHLGIKMASKVSMKSLISGNEFIRECKSGHERSFLEPEDGAKRSRKEDSFNCSECNKSFMEWFLFIHPFHSPLSFLFNNVNILNCVKQITFFILILNVGINQERISLGMNVFHGHLESIKTSGFRDLNLGAELLGKVLHHDSVTCSKECKNVFDEVFLVGIQFIPILEVLVKVDFISCPEWSEVFLVHLVNGVMLYWEKNESLVVFFQERFLNIGSSEDRGFFHF